MPRVDISLVTWNSAAELRPALDSVFAQTLQPSHVFVVENGSTDGTRDILAQYPACTVIANLSNLGFAAAHNLALAQSEAEYVLVMNPDVTLDPGYLEGLCQFADAHPRGAAFVGSIIRPDGVVDTTGISIPPWRLVRDRRERGTEPEKIFGVSGAVALYRRLALQDVAVDQRVFNPMLFAYKEDVELAWRLQWAGWEAYCVPNAVARHTRALQRETRRSRRSTARRFLSYRNHLLLYPLVESCGTLLPDFWAVLPAEVLRGIFLLCTDPVQTLRALAAAAKMWHAARTFARRERRAVHASRVRAAFRP